MSNMDAWPSGPFGSKWWGVSLHSVPSSVAGYLTGGNEEVETQRFTDSLCAIAAVANWTGHGAQEIALLQASLAVLQEHAHLVSGEASFDVYSQADAFHTESLWVAVSAPGMYALDRSGLAPQVSGPYLALMLASALYMLDPSNANAYLLQMAAYGHRYAINVTLWAMVYTSNPTSQNLAGLQGAIAAYQNQLLPTGTRIAIILGNLAGIIVAPGGTVPVGTTQLIDVSGASPEKADSSITYLPNQAGVDGSYNWVNIECLCPAIGLLQDAGYTSLANQLIGLLGRQVGWLGSFINADGSINYTGFSRTNGEEDDQNSGSSKSFPTSEAIIGAAQAYQYTLDIRWRLILQKLTQTTIAPLAGEVNPAAVSVTAAVVVPGSLSLTSSPLGSVSVASSPLGSLASSSSSLGGS